MALSIPSLPDVTVWYTDKDERYERVVQLFSEARCEMTSRNMLEERPTREELANVAEYVESGPSVLMRHSVCKELGIDPNDGPAVAKAIADDPARLRGPLVMSNRRKAVVARPPEFCYAVLVPEMPEGETPSSVMRRVIQGKLSE